MKGKFIYIFRDGMRLIDREGYQTMAQAKEWAKNHNKSAPYTEQVKKIIKREPSVIKKKKKTPQNNVGFSSGFSFNPLGI